MKQIKTLLCILSLFMFSIFNLNAQNNGKSITHTIKQGETLFSIARTYQVSSNDILKLNPQAADGIKAGNTLTIPVSCFHTIKAGETLYSLAKKNHVSIDALCNANPGLKADNFKVGMVIKIPAQDTTGVTTATDSSTPATPLVAQTKGIAGSGCKEMYKVRRRDTMFGIAREFGITEAELREANPEMQRPDFKLRRGDFICIPYPKPIKPKEVIPTNEQILENRLISAPQKEINMGVILPLNRLHKESEKMIEFYRGVLLAVQEAKAKGTSINVFAYDSGTTPWAVSQVTKNHPIQNLDFCIGPLYPDQIKPLSDWSKTNRIKLIVPFSSLGEEVYNNPYYYAINPPKSFTVSKTSRLCKEVFKQPNLVIINTGEKEDDATQLLKALEQNYGGAQHLNLTDADIKWLEAFNQYKTNLIIPTASSIKSLNKLMAKLKDFSKQNPEYPISLLGYPEWQTYASSHLENFYSFNTYIFSTFYRNPLTPEFKKFESTYQKAFHEETMVSWPSFGLLGYDIAGFFLTAIAQHGKGCDSYLNTIQAPLVQHKFAFERVSNWSGFINNSVEFIHYNKNHNIELIRLNNEQH